MIDREAALKKLRAEKAAIETKLAELKVTSGHLSRNITNEINEIRNLNNKIQELETGEVVVTDHAVLRYLERVHGIDVEAYRKNLVPERVHAQMTMLGAGKFPVTQNEEQYTLVVRDRKVITVITKEGQPK